MKQHNLSEKEIFERIYTPLPLPQNGADFTKDDDDDLLDDDFHEGAGKKSSGQAGGERQVKRINVSKSADGALP